MERGVVVFSEGERVQIDILVGDGVKEASGWRWCMQSERKWIGGSEYWSMIVLKAGSLTGRGVQNCGNLPWALPC